MMKLRQYLKNLAKAALNSLLTALLLSSCSVNSSAPYTLETISEHLVKICRDTYKIDAVSKLSGQTLWVYLPLEESLFIDAKAPQEYTHKFDIKSLEGSLNYETLSFSYHILEIPETKDSQNKTFNPDVADKINKVLRTARRVIFNLTRQKYEPRFFVMIATDIKTGIEFLNTVYVEDLRKVSYEMISWTEYQHRSVEDIGVSFPAIGDKTGKHILMRDIDFKDFLLEQIKQRLQTKFSRNEVEKGADIDDEVLKTIRYVLDIYKFNDFMVMDLKNALTKRKISFSRAAVFEENIAK